jgi:hypothetical protein
MISIYILYTVICIVVAITAFLFGFNHEYKKALRASPQNSKDSNIN